MRSPLWCGDYASDTRRNYRCLCPPPGVDQRHRRRRAPAAGSVQIKERDHFAGIGDHDRLAGADELVRQY